ncbi:hypothetical protein HNR28_002881 [Castellaniella defragrans]|uniref:Uncharacterized protein n=1 Tax=Castellaniella defragrans TaxID=75697 RepID=A0A7W9TQ41_CASDE|nr:hypothetical protein [Castellaniella defragrans]MBB6084833.1 hypothetical protein [Castellaniella defragrans]
MNDDVLVEQRNRCNAVGQSFAFLAHQEPAGSDHGDARILRQDLHEPGNHPGQQDIIVEQRLDILSARLLDARRQIAPATQGSFVSAIPKIIDPPVFDEFFEQVENVLGGAIVSHHDLVIRKILRQQAVDCRLEIFRPECRNHHGNQGRTLASRRFKIHCHQSISGKR